MKKTFFFIALVFLLMTFTVLNAQEIPRYVPVVTSSWWQIATEDYIAGAYSNKPAPGEPTLREHQEVSDFTIYKDANNKWQLVSAVRHTNFPATAHFLFRWQADQLTDENWQEMGVMKTTQDFPKEAGYATGVFFAPHCFLVDGTYYMYHNSNGTAHVLTSTDGINFDLHQYPDGSYIAFDTGEAGRDLNILDNRERDGLFYIYYTSIDRDRPELASRQFTDVYVRTSKHPLGPWSEPQIAGMGTPDRPESIVHYPANFVNPESQFVIFYDGFYYKFEQGHVVASKDPMNFAGKPVVANIFPHFNYPDDWWPGLAPEIVQDGDKWYIAYFVNHHEHPLKSLKLGGVFVAELGWKAYKP